MRIVDLFAGSGGFSLGFKRAGCDIVGAWDFEPDAIAVHAANMPCPPQGRIVPFPMRKPRKQRQADLTDLLSAAPTIADMRPDVIVGGPPCQAFSPSGKRLGDADPRAKLTEAFAVCVATARPRHFIMENVPQAQGSRVYRRAMAILRRAGYGISEDIVDMSWYGVGQARQRLIVFGALGEADGWATAYLEGAKATRRTTVRDVLGDSVGSVYFRMGHRSEDRVSFRSADEPGVTLTTTADRKQTGKGGYVVTKSDEQFFLRSDLYFVYPGGSSSCGTSSLDEPASTITRRAGDAPGPSYKPRKGDVLDVHSLPLLSFEQLAQLAGYPVDWNWDPNPAKPLTKASKMLMIANSVPAPFSELCARILLAHSRGEPPASTLPVAIPPGFARWLVEEGAIAQENVSQRMSDARAALRLLNGRKVKSAEDAEHRLHAAPGFEEMGRGRRSNLTTALRLVCRFMEKLDLAEKAKIKAKKAAVVADLMEAQQRHIDEEPTGVFPASFVRLRKKAEPDATADVLWVEAAE
ncbi:hypothetical protein ASG43_21500 [Aureimonas sp. Leaf454]|uniref:DNA cytosine methyltransferase n=1 Tax=Aureimonas sp. Leaf454 TaxID=1736381 RepID=UPI0006FE591D|nr:DNA cytosine methyltransferase [Aureimonas sp. Leaf454]KQT51183.1 hypothetical protein ASG43_21500 [Aureimonas sp. Leaf454]